MNFPSLLSHALMGKTGNKSALWGHPPVRQRLRLYTFLKLPKSVKSVPYTQGFYVAQYFYLACNNAKTFLDVKNAPGPSS